MAERTDILDVASMRARPAATAAMSGTLEFQNINGEMNIVDDEGNADPIDTSSAGITTLTGDVTAGPGSGSVAATVANIPTGATLAAKLTATAIAAPATPAAGKGAIYVDSTSKNLCVKDEAGTVKHGVQTTPAVANNFVTAISDAGVVATAQPAVTDLANAAAASIVGATAAGAHADLTGTQAQTVVMTATSTRIEVTGSDAQDVEFTGLTGDVDGDYEIEYYIVGKGTSSVTTQPEELATDQASRGWYTNGTTMTQSSGGTALAMLPGIANGVNYAGTVTLRSKSANGSRLFTSDHGYESDNYHYQYHGLWADVSTVITKVRIHASGGAHLGVGSWFVLRKLGKL